MLSSTTAPGKHFSSRTELQTHYKSDWHRYNLKRRENGLSMLNEEEFTARLEAALALRKEREGREERGGLDHLKDGKKGKQTKGEKKMKKDNRRKPAFAKRPETITQEPLEPEPNTEMEQDNDNEPMEEEEQEEEQEEEEPPEINPKQSLFDNHISPSLKANVSYMTANYSFYIPDIEYLIDLEGLLGYCSEKVRLGHTCLYCQRIFTTYEGCMKHMRDKRHCKICYEVDVDQEEFDVFYDFEEANASFLGRKKGVAAGGGAAAAVEDGQEEEANDDNMEEEGEWEDVSDDDEDVDMNDDDYDLYAEEIATHGFDITPLGELIFPDGRIIGHRGLARYYKQRFAPDRMERAAVRAARIAAGDRMYNGRVVNMYRLRGEMEQHQGGNEGGGEGTTLATMGRMSGCIPTGRNGKGILVSAGKGSFTSLSLYRYRAAVKKQRREDDKGRRLQYRTKQNMNKMNKKGNIISTGFSTSHAPR
jgi:pre-60S factor REI1